MYYVIDGVRWGSDGNITHVRWHTVDSDGSTIVHTEPEVVPVVDAARACGSADVRVYVGGEPGSFFRMKACSAGIDAEDAKGTPLRERMAHLPAF